MEHVKITPECGRQVHLKADNGYILRSRKTGREYSEISTLNPKQFEIVPLFDDEPKPLRKAIAPESKRSRKAIVNP